MLFTYSVNFQLFQWYCLKKIDNAFYGAEKHVVRHSTKNGSTCFKILNWELVRFVKDTGRVEIS